MVKSFTCLCKFWTLYVVITQSHTQHNTEENKKQEELWEAEQNKWRRIKELKL